MLKKPSAPELTPEESQALAQYKACHGRTWKSKLQADWMRAGTACPSCKAVYPTLHRIRNTPALGPEWLHNL